MAHNTPPDEPVTGSPRVSRRDLATRAGGERDPLGILERQNEARFQPLVPLRIERMSVSPFTFYRGTAAIMAADQARDPHSGILVASCGDAHLSNFGFYASPQRTLLFDLNDFDEAAWAPWEWDVKRLVTSIVIGGRATDRKKSVIEKAAREAVTAYVAGLHEAAAKTPLERYYSHFDPQDTDRNLDKASRRALKLTLADAVRRTGPRAARRLTGPDTDGKLRFIETPPAMTQVEPELVAHLEDNYEAYRRSAYVDIRALLSQYTVEDIARRAVGVGSVGTRCFVALLRDRDGGLFILQVKEAVRSVLEEYGGIRQPDAVEEGIAEGGQGNRVVGLQRVLQAYSDPFLGHMRGPLGDYYVRQFHDMKGSVDVEQLEDAPFIRYARVCARVLARAHGQSPRFTEVVGYVGKGRRVTESIVAWSYDYADVSLADYRAFIAAQRH